MVTLWCIYIGCYSNNVGVNTLTQFLSLSSLLELRVLKARGMKRGDRKQDICTLVHKVAVLNTHATF